jgi:hypothetical protein
MKKFNWKLVFPAFSMSIGLVGCGSIVYKDAANTYVTAGKAAINSMNDANKSLGEANDGIKAVIIASDKFCPISYDRIFLRQLKYTQSFANAIKSTPNVSMITECQTILNQLPPKSNCTTADDLANGVCSTSCYSKPEMNCISQLEEAAARHRAKLTGDEAKNYEGVATDLLKNLTLSEYKRGPVLQNALSVAAVKFITEYLDMLDKLSQKRDSEVSGDAKKLSENLNSFTDKAAKLADTQLSDKDKATQTQVSSAITAFGKFLKDMNDISANAEDAAAIRQLVADTQTTQDVKGLIEGVKTIAISDALLISTLKNLATIDARNMVQARFNETTDAYERRKLLDARDNINFIDKVRATAPIAALFDAMIKSNEALVKLILNPDDKDLQAIANARFQEFKLFVEDVATIATLLH